MKEYPDSGNSFLMSYIILFTILKIEDNRIHTDKSNVTIFFKKYFLLKISNNGNVV